MRLWVEDNRAGCQRGGRVGGVGCQRRLELRLEPAAIDKHNIGDKRVLGLDSWWRRAQSALSIFAMPVTGRVTGCAHTVEGQLELVAHL